MDKENPRVSGMDEHKRFVMGRLSPQSADFDAYIESLKKLHDAGCDISNLDTAITGMSAESNEMMEVIKKLKFQGKEWTPDVEYHLQREMGDIIFYWLEGCHALGINPQEVIDMNREKLEARYPDGFEVAKSENRKEGDI